MNRYKYNSTVNILMIVLMVLYLIFYWYSWSNNHPCTSREQHMLITAITLFFSVGWVIVMQVFRLLLNWQSLIIPLLFLFMLAFPEAMHVDYSNYFIYTACVTALAALYRNTRSLLFFIITYMSFAIFLYFRGYFNYHYMAQDYYYTTNIQWSISVITSIAIYILLSIIMKSEKTASAHSETFYAVLKNTNDHIIVLDNERRVKYMSNLLIKKFGFKDFPYIVENRPFVDLFRQFKLKQYFCEILSQNNYEANNVELIDISNPDKNHFMNIKFQKMSNDTGFLLQVTDITDISLAKNEVEKANNAKSEFLANMSHELRTPLNAINGLAELELRKNLPTDTKLNLEKISTSGEVLLSTINDILDISKIEAGRFDLNIEEYSFTSFMSDTLNMNVVRIGSKPISIDVEIDENIPEKLIGDEMRIRQIFSNLISNAIKYTFDGTIWVKVKGIIKGNSIWISLSVQDTGIGISKENLSKLFRNYSMVDVKSHKEIEGTGLGLSITKQIVDLMDGDISVESVYGKGSTFSVQFRQDIADPTPIGLENAKNIENFVSFSKQSSKYQKLEIVKLPNIRTLIVDDIQVNIDVAAGMLSAYEMQIDTANSGKEAIAKVKESEYDIIFMDHMMPEMDGIETLKNIRKLNKNYLKNVPIIALTANAIVGMDKMFLENGFQDYLSKPMNAQKLDFIIHRWLIDDKNDININATQEEWNEVERRFMKRRNDFDRRNGNDRRRSEQCSEKEVYYKLLAQNPVNGINFDEAIRQFNSMPKIYVRVLKSFFANTPTVIKKLQNPTAKTIDDYKITVHGLKGSCFGIGANDIAKLAESLEKEAGAQNLTAVLEKNDALLQQVRNLLDEVSPIITKADELSFGQIKKSEPDKDILLKLNDAANSFDIEKINDCLCELEKFTYESNNDLIKKLREFADNFNYDKITETANQILNA